MDLPLQLPYHTCEAKTLYWPPEKRSDELPRILRKLRVETMRNIPTYPHISLISRHKKKNVFCLHRMWTERHKFQPGFMICSREFIRHARWRGKKKKTWSRSLIQALISGCFLCVCVFVWVRLSLCVQVCARTAEGGPLLTQPEPLRAFNRRCYLVSQVLRLCCSNATGARTLTCTRWLCVLLGEAPRIDLIEPPVSLFVFFFLVFEWRVSRCYGGRESGQWSRKDSFVFLLSVRHVNVFSVFYLIFITLKL